MNINSLTKWIPMALMCIGVLLLPGVLVAQPEPATVKARTQVILGPDDSIHVLALNCEEISKEWRIGATGDVNFPLIGRIKIGGLTLEQAEQLIANRLKKYLNDPQVTVYTSEVRSSPVTVAGAVDKPGRYQISGASTVFNLLMQAGGPKNAGPTLVVKRSMARVTAPVGPGVKIDKDGEYALIEFDMKTVMDGPDGPAMNSDFKLEPFDVVTVSAAPTGRFVHISGEVVRPGNIELVTQDSVSLMKLVAVAGGLSRTAAPDRTIIMHVTAEGVQTSTSVVDVKKIMEGKSKDLDLISGDIVLVPNSKSKTLAIALTSAAITAGLTTAIYSLGRY